LGGFLREGAVNENRGRGQSAFLFQLVEEVEDLLKFL
jgi:hypothetical protein